MVIQKSSVKVVGRDEREDFQGMVEVVGSAVETMKGEMETSVAYHSLVSYLAC